MLWRMCGTIKIFYRLSLQSWMTRWMTCPFRNRSVLSATHLFEKSIYRSVCIFNDHDIQAGELSEVIESAIDTFYMLFILKHIVSWNVVFRSLNGLKMTLRHQLQVNQSINLKRMSPNDMIRILCYWQHLNLAVSSKNWKKA